MKTFTIKYIKKELAKYLSEKCKSNVSVEIVKHTYSYDFIFSGTEYALLKLYYYSYFLDFHIIHPFSWTSDKDCRITKIGKIYRIKYLNCIMANNNIIIE